MTGRLGGSGRPILTGTSSSTMITATVANLTLVAAKAGLTGETGSDPPSAGRSLVAGIANPATWLGRITTLTLLAAALLTKSFPPTRGLRPNF